MKIQFLGAVRVVTGSKHLLTLSNGKKILLDCGFFQGKGSEMDSQNRNFLFDPASIDYLILSHAHIDHSGNIPNLVKQGFKGTVICTPATMDLCRIMLADSAHIQEHDTAYLNKKRISQGLEPFVPIYEIKDAENSLKQFTTVKYNSEYTVCEGVKLTFTDSGHILGAAAINLEITENGTIQKLFFSGDIGRYGDSILRDPEPFPQADYIITESTYGDRLHGDRHYSEQQLFDAVFDTCIIKKGKVIIPAFSLGRTQEIVYSLNQLSNKKMLPPINVYVDSPLSVNATTIMREHPECFNEEIINSLKKDANPFGFDNLIYIHDVEESKKLNFLKEPCIIISASGMIEAGRIKHHVANNISNSNNTILIVGYAEPRSIAGQLRAGHKKIKIFGTEYEVKANITVMDAYSAHGDYNEMLKYLNCQDKKKVKQLFLVHGDYEVQKHYREKLIAEGFSNILIPAQGDEVELA